MTGRRRISLTALLVLVVLLGGARVAAAHPLGNFSFNHLTEVSVAADRIDLRYILDQAEIPTFQERGASPSALLARKRAEVLRFLELTVDGRRVDLRLEPGATISSPPGQGGLFLTRVELPLSAPVRMPATIELHDRTFAGRVGWKAIVTRPGKSTAVRSDAPSGDPTDGLRHYPTDMLSSPLDQRTARLTASPGSGTLIAPRTAGGDATTTNRAGDGLAGVFERAAAGRGVLLVLLLAAFGWGAMHALSPGHGKAMVAAYLVGTRGTPRHAVALGLIVTVTHTAGVFALGLITLLLSRYVLPEQLYPWLNLVSGVLVVAVGAAVLRSRVRWARAQRSRPQHHDHASHHAHPHGHSHEHEHEHDHGHGHSHGHDHLPEQVTWRTLLAAGAAAGLIPCPSALVVLLAALSQHQIALGLLLIVAFSLGLAGTLTAIGLAVVSARRLTFRFDVTGRAITVLPAVSALLICGVGCLLTLQAVREFV